MNGQLLKETLNHYEKLIDLLKEDLLPIVDGWVSKCSRRIPWGIIQELREIQKDIDERLKKHLTEELEWIEEKKKELEGDCEK